jgi:signal peptidase I
MRQFWKVGKNLWRMLPCRVLVAATFAAIMGVAAARAFIVSVSMVSGMSMAPTFEPGSWVYTAPISHPLQRGDIVVIDDGNKECAIKRIVGLPGETVHIKHGYVFINRRMLLEPYIPKRTYTFPTRLPGAFILGEGQYFVLGDNRPSSSDSRNYGPIDRGQIKRRIPLPEGTIRAYFGPHLLPQCEAILPSRAAAKMQGS